MSQTVIECLCSLLRKRQRAGLKYVWLSEANRNCLGKNGRQAEPACSGPAAQVNAASRFQQPASPKLSSAPLTWGNQQNSPQQQSAQPKPPSVPSATSQAPIFPKSAPVFGKVSENQRQTATPPRSDSFLNTVSQADWQALGSLVEQCQACRLATTRHNIVFEDGCRKARLMFIGEGPGQDEDMQGIPFVGRAGQLLTNMIKAMGLDRTSSNPATSVYIANIVKCRPPQNRNPQQDESEICLPFLQRQIELVHPEAIVLLGAVALKGLMGLTGISKLRGNWLEFNGIPVMPTFHPAYILRCENQPTLFIEEKRKVWHDLQAVMQHLHLPMPQKK